MRLLQITIGLLIWLLFSRGSIWAAIPFQEYERYPILGTICAQLEKQVDQHAYKILHVDSEENSYYFDVEGTRLFIDNMVIYSRYPVNPVNDIDNLRKYLRFLSHSLYIGRNEKRNEFELIRTYPKTLYEDIYRITDGNAKKEDTTSDNSIKYNTSSISIYICNLSNISVDNNFPMKDSQATLALYLDHDNRLIGYDFLGSEELQRMVADKNKGKLQNNRIKKDWRLTGWQNYIYLPIDIGICAKQTAFELIKIPFHLVGISVVKFFIFSDIEVSDKPFVRLGSAMKLGGKTSWEHIKDIRYIWLYRLDKLNHQCKLKNLSLNLVLEPIREVPFIGNHIPRDTHYSSMGTHTPKYLFISRGIYGRSKDEQDTKNWEQFMKNILIEDIKIKEIAATNVHAKQGIDISIKGLEKSDSAEKLQVRSIPYLYGSITDVLWSLLNLSSGYGYEMAYSIVDGYKIGAGDVIFLTGHSGGVQRCLIAEKLLLENQIYTQRRVGLAGPSQGNVYWSNRKSNQNYITFLNQNHDYKDIVSNLNTYTDIMIPSMGISNWILKRNEERIRIADPTLLHITPGIIDPKTRIPASGYLGKEYINFFSNSYVGEQLVEAKPKPTKEVWWKQIQQIFPSVPNTKK